MVAQFFNSSSVSGQTLGRAPTPEPCGKVPEVEEAGTSKGFGTCSKNGPYNVYHGLRSAA